MSGSFLRGEQGSFAFQSRTATKTNAQTIISNVRSWNATIEQEIYDITTQGSGFRKFKEGLISLTGSAEIIYKSEQISPVYQTSSPNPDLKENVGNLAEMIRTTRLTDGINPRPAGYFNLIAFTVQSGVAGKVERPVLQSSPAGFTDRLSVSSTTDYASQQTNKSVKTVNFEGVVTSWELSATVGELTVANISFASSGSIEFFA